MALKCCSLGGSEEMKWATMKNLASLFTLFLKQFKSYGSHKREHCTQRWARGSAAMKGKKQGCVNRSSLKHSMVITLVRSEFELEAIWSLFYGWTALLKLQKWKNDENRSKSPSILREIIFPENRLMADFYCSIPSNRIQTEDKKWLAAYVSVFRSSHGQNRGRANNLICIL